MTEQPPAYDGPFRFHGGTADIDPKWININTLKAWLRTCDTQHVPRCFDTVLFESEAPRWLIDTRKGCLVRAQTAYQYAALSYVWGQTETVKTTKNNLAYLLEEGCIFAHERLLPRTIRDTMRLVKLLDIQYLWVDCLCIVQDDTELKHVQIQEMGAVYARAYVTIIAANGWDANHGLRGIRNITEPRHLSRYAEDDFYESLQPHSSIWYSRGWTFQEMIFARRKIMFHYQVAVWECQCETWHEATRTDTIPSITNVTGSEFHINRWGWRNGFHLWPDVQQYIEMVREYNDRQLTFPADKLQAIAGLMTVWNRSFHGGFISGLPQMFFDEALLWQPSSIPRRRTPKTGGSDQTILPSWSWAGWEGLIQSSEWASQWDYLSPALYKGVVVWKLNSTVEWFHGESRENQQPVNVSSHRYRHCLTDTWIPLPPGWSRRPAAADVTHEGGNARQNANKDLAKRTHFVHKQFAGINFCYPIPLQEEDQQTRSQISPPFLFGRTRRGYFEFSDRREFASPLSPISILDNRGRSVGMIQLHDSSLVSPLTYTLVDDSSELELVSISAGTTTSLKDWYGLDNLDIDPGGLRDANLFEFYNVLCIKWEEGIAYRVGLGRVSKSAWERQATEWIDLTLG